MRKFGLIAALGLVLLAPTAAAEKISRQVGATFWHYLEKPETVSGPIEPGGLIATMTVRPSAVVRILGDTLPRPGIVGGEVPGVTAGEILYAVRTEEDRTVYCAFNRPDNPVRQRQCYLDLQGNGVFVASYVTNTFNRPADAGMTGHWLGDLAGVPPVKYEAADAKDAPTETYRIRFIRWRGDRIVVNDFLGEESPREPITCQIGEDKPCSLRDAAIATFRRVGQTGIELVSFKPTR
jgi:nitrogen regulatory protein PII-like uncharacterized protein